MLSGPIDVRFRGGFSFQNNQSSLKGRYNAVSCIRVVYTVKELESHAKHGQSISVLKISLPGSYKLRRVFFDRGSC